MTAERGQSARSVGKVSHPGRRAAAAGSLVVTVGRRVIARLGRLALLVRVVIPGVVRLVITRVAVVVAGSPGAVAAGIAPIVRVVAVRVVAVRVIIVRRARAAAGTRMVTSAVIPALASTAGLTPAGPFPALTRSTASRMAR